MTFTNPLYAGVLLLAAIAVMSIFSLFRHQQSAPGRFRTIDGLRGYLALFVFFHHSSVWFVYGKTGHWEAPASNLYVHLGQTSVSLFFMITSFLFIDKLIDKRKGSMHWRGFFIGRLFRLTPLYLVAMAALFLIVAILSNGELKDSPQHVAESLLKWMVFTGLGAPDINGVHTSLITSGVTWSLPYEWWFYLVLPVVFFMIGGRGAVLFIPLSLLATVWFVYVGMSAKLALVFAGGAVAAVCIRNESCRNFSASAGGSALATLLILSIPFFPTAFNVVPLAILTLAFCLIACGANLFGALTARVSHSLGELAYSIYLLHGIVLFSLNHFILGEKRFLVMSATAYLGVLVLVVPVLLALSIFTFKYIETPGINYGKKWSHKKSPIVTPAARGSV